MKFDPAGEYLLEVQRYCLLQLDAYEKERGKSFLFGWPMDRIADQPYGYAVHCSIVRDWNKEDRKTEIVKFHREWLSNLDNIKKAVEEMVGRSI